MMVFVASNMPTSYPHKLQKPSTVSERVRKTADTFIMDSGIGDDVTNREVIELAVEYDADYVVCKDILHDFHATTRNVEEFFNVFSEYDCDITVMVPVQCNPEMDEWHVDHLPELPEHSHYVLGGMATPDVSTSDAIKSIRRFREAVGPDVWVHGLGVGGGIEFVEAVAGTGWLDSIDCSTPEQAAMFGSILDERLRQQTVMVFPGGEGKSKRTWPLAEFNSFQLRDVWERESEQSGLSQWQ